MSARLEGEERLLATTALEPIEGVLDDLDFNHSRGDGEVHFAGRALWTDIHGFFALGAEGPSLSLSVSFDMRVPAHKQNEVSRLVGLINESLWLGHFEMWGSDGALVWRHTQAVPGRTDPSSAEARMMADAAICAIDRYFPAFNFVIWADRTPEDAIIASVIEVAGHA
jgi:hypothetical protein